MIQGNKWHGLRSRFLLICLREYIEEKYVGRISFRQGGVYAFRDFRKNRVRHF